MSGPEPGPNYQKTVELRKRGLTYGDIALLLEISRSRVGQILQNAIRRGDLDQDPVSRKRSASELLDKMPGYRQTVD